MSAFDYLQEREALAKDILQNAMNNKKAPWEIPYIKEFPKNIFAKQDHYNGYNAIYLITHQQRRESAGDLVGYRYIAQTQLEKEKAKFSLKTGAKAYNVEYWGLASPKNSFTIKQEKDTFILLNSEYKRAFFSKDINEVFNFVHNSKGFIYKAGDKDKFLSYLDSIGVNSTSYSSRYKQTGKPFCKNYLVYNESDIEGSLPPVEPKVNTENTTLINFMNNNDVKLVASNNISLKQSENGDSFLMPEKKNFKDENSYYSTYLYLQLLRNIQTSALAVKEDDPYADVFNLRNQIIAQMGTLLLSVELRQGYNPQEFTHSNLLADLSVKMQGISEKESFIEKFGDTDAFLMKSFSLANTMAKKTLQQIMQYKVEEKLVEKEATEKPETEKQTESQSQENIFKMRLI